jgi:hypothetical protein
MKFSELPLYRAIQKVYELVESGGGSPRGNRWLIDQANQRQLYKMMVDQMDDFTCGVPWTMTEVLSAWETYGKAHSVCDDKSTKYDIIIDVAARFGNTCFYRGRVPTPCSEDIHLDRLLPGKREGEYTRENSILSCSTHNQERGGKSIEDYVGK